MASKEVIGRRLETRKNVLEEYYTAWKSIVSGGVKSYAIGSRNLTKHDLPQIEESIKELEKEIDTLENLLSGGKRRKAVGVLPRDW
ncbi:MAG: hypothetical protein SOR93_09385 [Clostridiales Family XIII bacterium]|uniref:Uncharacterized protein n=1 Tax=Hominibacterium faecale TaxID=2839743 RepID=A0A9J6QTX6_9FIRM|nr:hypothetical protein [Hominibacterium faecale]MCI7302312.1 hypothetical protein [Clostridia bacterium]MCU7378135.1 hypothetical protein [Hominibacterium faecale]MDY3011446.1 hypothetical protein [Clostridiales Family XIII bacterium]MDY4602105.1 hypothetical protein [Bacteroides uniformis]